MEKLIELLNQFEEEKKSDNRWGLTYIDNELMGLSNIREARLAVISKEYKFINWLVENDKIDIEPIMKKEIGYWRNVEGVRGYETYNLENALLMLLAIQDKPIEFLINMLK